MRLALKISSIAGVLVAAAGAAGFAVFTVPQISEKSIEWTCSLSAPSENCTMRMRSMGHIWSLKDNLDRAQIWYARAAEHGDVTAMFHLAWIYERAAYSERDEAYEVRRQKRAAGISYDDLGPEPNIANFARAAEWYRKSADKGFAPAMNNLGELYMGGNGVPRDPREGFRLMHAAALAGNPIAAWNVVMAHMIRAGVDFDQAEVEKWSTWRPNGMTSDLADLTLRRTNMNGEGLPPQYREGLRIAAEKREPVTLTMKPLQPDPSLPTLQQVAR